MAHIEKRQTANGDRWDVRYRIGKKNQRRTFTREKDAKLYRADVERKLALGDLWVERPELHGDFMQNFLARKKTRVQPQTYVRLVEIRAHLAPLDDTELASLTVGQVEDLILGIAAKHPRTAQQALALEKQMLHSARSRRQKVDEAIFEIKPPQHKPRQVRFLTREEVDRLAAFCSEGRLVVFLAETGLRVGEAFALTDADVDWQEGSVLVRGGKTDAARRTVYLSKRAVVALKEQRLKRATGTALLFPTPEGLPWVRGRNRSNFYGRVWLKATKRAGLEGITPHMLRHTFASWLISAGVHAKVVAEQLGHADGGVLVMRLYGHLAPAAGAQAARALDALDKTAAKEAQA